MSDTPVTEGAVVVNDAPAPAAPTSPTEPAADGPNVNRWAKVRESARNLGGPTPIPKLEGDEYGADDDDSSKPASTDSKQSPDPNQPPTKGADEKKGDTEKPAAARQGYEFVGSDGKPVEIALPEGAKVRFKADGRPVEATLEQLVSDASKTRYLERQSSSWGQKESRLNQALAQHQKRLADASEGWAKMADRIFEAAEAAIQGDPDTYEQLRAEWARTSDPDVVEGQKAKAELEELRSRLREDEDARRQQEEEQHRTEFTAQLETAIGQLIPKFEHLTEKDTALVLRALDQRFERVYQQLEAQYAPHRHRYAVSDEEFQEELAQHAADQVYTTEAVARLMKVINEDFATRFGPKRAALEEHERAAKARQEAEQHNRRTDTKLDQVDRTTVRERGVAPAAGVKQDERPDSFAGHQSRWKRTLRGG